jgi:hypothetical protein
MLLPVTFIVSDIRISAAGVARLVRSVVITFRPAGSIPRSDPMLRSQCAPNMMAVRSLHWVKLCQMQREARLRSPCRPPPRGNRRSSRRGWPGAASIDWQRQKIVILLERGCIWCSLNRIVEIGLRFGRTCAGLPGRRFSRDASRYPIPPSLAFVKVPVVKPRFDVPTPRRVLV